MQKISLFTMTAVAAITLASCSMAHRDYPEMDGGFYVPNGEAAEPAEGTGESGDRFDAITDNPFVNTAEEPVSTFSVDADGASYAYMRGVVNNGYWRFGLNPNSVRIEEYLNYFTFDYPSPTDGHAVALNSEIGVCPWDDSHLLMRVGMKGKELTAEPQSNYVLLVDVSGSMHGADRLDLLKKGMIALVENLNATDRISVITYSGNVEMLVESTEIGGHQQEIIRQIKRLTANGSTAGGEAMKMAYKEAVQHYIEGGNNRIIMGTDGDFNVGVSSTDELLEMVQNYCKRGIYITVCGFGIGNLNDAMMETVSNRGNGTYVYVDSEEEMMKVFVHERSHFFAVANDCKAQVTFDSTLVAQYRLIGYENRVLATEDFSNDSVDAAEIGAGQTITALYELVPTQEWAEDMAVATFDFRYKESLSGSSILLSETVSEWVGAESENLNFAAGVAGFGMLLRKSPYAGTAHYAMIEDLIRNNSTFDPHGYRHQLTELVEKVGR